MGGEETSDASPAAPSSTIVSGHVAYADRAIELLVHARREVVLLSQDLDRRIYGDEDFVETLRAFLLQHRRARLRAIVHTPRTAMLHAHRLVELGRALSSRIEFRELLPERKSLREEYLIVDDRAMLHRSAPEELEARCHTEAPALVREQLRQFETLWQESPPAREFANLRL